MYQREAEKKIKDLAKKFPVLAVTGPRQSGKTTLVKATFKNFAYFSLEDLDVRLQAKEDPRGFLSQNTDGMIIDEAQHVPELFSYIQTIVDKNQKMGQFILTGSQNFLLLEKISQSLAGRVGIIQLLPFSLKELHSIKEQGNDINFWIYRGFYPPIYDRKIPPIDFYPQYIQTYVDRDVRSLQNIFDLSTFQKFVKLCSGRIGNLLNINSLATDCGISFNTAKSWLSLLEASYIIFLLKPHHINFNKRLTKHPKLYFYDTGLACSLLGIHDEEQVQTHYLRGALFENLIIGEYIKSQFNAGLPNNAFFWRDNTGNEIDLLIEKGGKAIPIEIKSGETLNSSFYDSLHYYSKLSEQDPSKAILFYGGDRTFSSQKGATISWKNLKKGFGKSIAEV
ncbi:AAA family ATPase [Opitutia bacterium SCGC AG-212-L18]|nr:AAA family ATPase [Opitutae bacterium SCGC AG-212-L18]